MSSWSDIAGAIAKGAPLLGSLLPGPGTLVGAGVGAAASIVASALGVPADPDSITAALRNDPEALAKVRQAELDNQAKLAEIAMQREQNALAALNAQYAVAAADRSGARQYASATEDHTARNLAYLYTGALFAVIAAHLWIVVLRIPIEPVAMNIISTLEGVLIAMVLGSKEFFFGSSSSAVKQQDKITNFATSPGAVSAPAPAAGNTLTTTIQTPSDSQQTVTVGPADDVFRGH
jgi:hypothetical protein